MNVFEMNNKKSIVLALMYFVFTMHTASADIITFDVNFSGVAFATGHTLSVYGTISVDPFLPMTAEGTASRLFLRHNQDPPIEFTSTPNYGSQAPSELAWSLVDGNLHVVRTGTTSQFFGWAVEEFPTYSYFNFGAGPDTYHGFAYANVVNGDFDNVYLKTDSGPDGPIGFLVGTAVPEPSTILLVASGGLILALRRRRTGPVTMAVAQDWRTLEMRFLHG